jgi:hypothetical protein
MESTRSVRKRLVLRLHWSTGLVSSLLGRDGLACHGSKLSVVGQRKKLKRNWYDGP